MTSSSLKPIIAPSSSGLRWITLIFLMLMGALLGMLLGFALQRLFGFDEANSLEAMRTMQLSTQFGLFFIPPFAYSWLFLGNPSKSLFLNRLPSSWFAFAGLILMLSALPFVHLLAEWNREFQFPERFSSLEHRLRLLENNAQEMTEKFLSVNTIGGLLFNIFMIALIPALGEELLFRATIQQQLLRTIRNEHLAVALSALVFSVLHFQFFGLVPRFVLGLFLGYFFLWSKSLWVPVFMHFLNNALAVVAYYLHHNKLSETSMEDFGSTNIWWQLILSILIMLFLLIAAYRKRLNKANL